MVIRFTYLRNGGGLGALPRGEGRVGEWRDGMGWAQVSESAHSTAHWRPDRAVAFMPLLPIGA